ncbi:MAG: EamA family transporter [Spirochaetaceae bacterium]|nr:EamA family transporter [Spirochaetaceae bacterium]
MTTVLVFGTFDVLHPGHRWFLRKARRLGNQVVAVVSRDDYVMEWKGHPPLSDQQSRIDALQESGLVDRAVLADERIRTYGVIDEIRPDIICLGHDQKALKDDLEQWLTKRGDERSDLDIHVLPAWRRGIYSSTRRNNLVRGAGRDESPTLTWVLSLAMVAAMMIFGFSWVSGKRISDSGGPGTLAFIRFVMTTVFFLPLFFSSVPVKLTADQRRRGWMWTAFSAMAICSYNTFFFLGLDAGLAGKGGLIVTTLNPLFTFLIVLFIGRSRPSTMAVLGIAVGVLGGILLFQPWNYTTPDWNDSGNFAFLGAALSWSTLTVLSRKAQQYMGFRRFNIGLYIIAAGFMLIPALVETGGVIPADLDWLFWKDMLFISLAVGAFGTGMYFIASSKLGASRGSAFTYLVPVSAILFSSIILGEKPEPVMLIGGLLAVLAVILINRR